MRPFRRGAEMFAPEIAAPEPKMEEDAVINTAPKAVVREAVVNNTVRSARFPGKSQ